MHASLLPYDTVRVTADDSVQSTPQRNHKAARTGAAETTGPQLMEATGLSFSPSALRTVALPHAHPHTEGAAMGRHTAEHMAEPAAQLATTGGDRIAARATIHPTVTAWRLWTESSWPLLLNIEGQRDKLAEAAVRFIEELIDHGFHRGVAPQFAAYAGITLPPAEILPCLATYRDRKNLIPNLELELFAPYKQWATTTATTAPLLPPTDSPNPFAADTASATPPPPLSGPRRSPAQGGTAASPLNAEPAKAQHIHELTRMLTETRIENDRPRQNIVPPLVPVSDTSPNMAWATDRFALTVWRKLHEALRCRRQGQLSAPGGPMIAPAQGAIQGPMPGPVAPGAFGNPMFMRNAHKPGHCFRCGAYGHWSRDCPNMQQAGHVTGWQLGRTSGTCQDRRRGPIDAADNGTGRRRPAPQPQQRTNCSCPTPQARPPQPQPQALTLRSPPPASLRRLAPLTESPTPTPPPPPALSECLFFFGVFLSMLARAAGP